MKAKELQIFKLTEKFKEEKDKVLNSTKLPPLVSWMSQVNDYDIPNDLSNLFLVLRKKLLISKSIIFRLSSFSNSYGFLGSLYLVGDWLEAYCFKKIENFVDVLTILTDVKLFNTHMFCSLLRDMYLYILQITKILSCDDKTLISNKLLNKYLMNKNNDFIFDIRKKSGDFENIFKKIANEINKLKENDICKQQYLKIKNIFNDKFIDNLCDYVHHNHYSNDHPYFFPFAIGNTQWGKNKLNYCIETFNKIFNLFLIIIYLFHSISFANMFDYISELEFTGKYPSTDLNKESEENFEWFIEEFNKI